MGAVLLPLEIRYGATRSLDMNSPTCRYTGTVQRRCRVGAWEQWQDAVADVGGGYSARIRISQGAPCVI